MWVSISYQEILCEEALSIRIYSNFEENAYRVHSVWPTMKLLYYRVLENRVLLFFNNYLIQLFTI